MNEGCATFVHYEIMNRLHEKGLINDGTILEVLHSHTSVVFQPDFDDPRYHGINPYALGFAMMRDIKRICLEPTDEDREWFPDIAGNGDPYGTLRHAWANYRDESFVLQYLSPQLIREFRLFKRIGRVRQRRTHRSTPSMTSAAIATSAARSPATTIWRGTTPISRSATSISPATAASS